MGKSHFTHSIIYMGITWCIHVRTYMHLCRVKAAGSVLFMARYINYVLTCRYRSTAICQRYIVVGGATGASNNTWRPNSNSTYHHYICHRDFNPPTQGDTNIYTCVCTIAITRIDGIHKLKIDVHKKRVVHTIQVRT